MSTYKLKIDLNVLNHLGLNLYSNVPAVLSELIANTWDADATEVKINTLTTNKITIEDNGCGMNKSDLNDKFLNIGYQRRKDNNDLTPTYERKVMGRKGIGKLSIFSIAEHIKIYTKKDNRIIGIDMDVSDIHSAITREETYEPKEIYNIKSDEITEPSGTKIVLERIKKRVQISIDNNLKKRVSRRFDIWSDTFKVYINDSQVSVEDRDYFHKLEFAVRYGKYQNNFSSIEDDKIHTRLTKSLGIDTVSGWIGLVKESGGLQDGDDNLNKISVLSRGKVALEDILELYREGGLYTKFLIGEIRADFLDSTEKDDIATSSRQDFIQNDERFIKLKDFIFNELKFIEKSRAKYKADDGAKKASEIPAIKDWLDALQGDSKKSAKKLFGRINSIATDEKHRKILYKHGVLAFEHLHHKEKIQQLDDLDAGSLEVAVKLFSELDDIEASWYYQITEGRLDVIRKLKEHISENKIEKIIQQHIYDHLWLLDPSWDRATENPAMEESIKYNTGKLYLTEEEKRGRLDIRYRKVSGRNIIIELKRNSVNPKAGDLLEQVKKYKTAVKKELQAYGEDGSIEVICLVGNGLAGWKDLKIKQDDEKSLLAQDIRVITYQQLIKDAENSYKSYLDKQKDKGRIQKLLESIDDN